MEYLVIVGVVLVILVPLTLLYFKYTSESSYAIATTKAEAIANEISRAANSVYGYGKDSQLTIEADFPDSIKAIDFNNNEIIFTILNKQGGTSEIAKVADINFVKQSAKIPVFQGRRKILIKSLGSQVLVTIPCEGTQQICATQDSFDGCGANGCVIECKNTIWTFKQSCNNGCNPNTNQCNGGGQPT